MQSVSLCGSLSCTVFFKTHLLLPTAALAQYSLSRCKYDLYAKNAQHLLLGREQVRGVDRRLW